MFELTEFDYNLLVDIVNMERKRRNVTYRKLANDLGVSLQFIFDFFNKKRYVNFIYLIRLLSYFGFSVMVDFPKEIKKEVVKYEV